MAIESLIAIDQVQDGISGAMRAALTPPGGTCLVRRIEPVATEDLATSFQQLVLNPPCILIALKSLRYSVAGNGAWRKFRAEAGFTLILSARNLRGFKAAMDGGPLTEVGLVHLVAAAEQALIDANFGLDIDPLKPVSLEAQIEEKLGCLVYRMDWATGWIVQKVLDVPDLLRIDALYNQGQAEDLVNLRP